ncbi:putative receptor protein kinase ZmPK1 isoform X2 [Diospyros lotus]|uniref:putative receptor protein kinase ZmPK1 isoform X2 n=1 Tax=Diospyros lotus TaxID=55363 RepID=UPI00224FF47E|nr:putative receptor protein kinase ZmPK1 isoform X2 [Diospyros lotus]
MRTPIFLVIILVLQSLSPSSSTISSLKKGSSLSVEKQDDVLVSPNGVFTAGFYSVGENAFCFAIWFTQRLHDGSHTIVWMANRDQPVNGRLSKLKLLKNGDLILTDAGQLDVWSAGTGNRSISKVQLQLNNTGNLVLLGSESKTGISENSITLWQSFDWPTDTLLPYQRLTRYAKLVSSRSRSNYSSGYYKLFFDNNNFLKLLYDGPVLSSLYWPDPWLYGWDANRVPYAYGRERNAAFNTSGHFQSTDGLEFRAADYGVGVQRRLTMDVDGNARLYSLEEKKGRWTVSWQAMAQPCRVHGVARQRLLNLNTGFRKFTYNELKKASRNFSHEIGRGGSGIIYKGVLQDGRVAAIKLLINEANYQGEEVFMVELSTIGRLNHMNLIEMWGYCVEGKHRLLVYEYMEYGSLAETLSSSQTLNSLQRFDIAVGTAKGLAYLHEECLEWVLHCDVKPQNILLDGDYQPKVADFGLSKLLNRAGGNSNSSFSRIRGTRGYMAPEWIFNLHITSKVDVYSYGMVVLEMVTGKTPMTGHHTSFSNDGEMMEVRGLVNWVREKISENGRRKGSDSLEKIVDPKLQGEFDVAKMEVLVDVALRCVEEDRDARPTMSQVIEMLLGHENDR